MLVVGLLSWSDDLFFCLGPDNTEISPYFFYSLGDNELLFSRLGDSIFYLEKSVYRGLENKISYRGLYLPTAGTPECNFDCKFVIYSRETLENGYNAR